MAEARRLGEIAGPMLDRLLKQRPRLRWVWEDDQSIVLITPVLRVEWHRIVFLLAFGPYRAGFSWRRFA